MWFSRRWCSPGQSVGGEVYGVHARPVCYQADGDASCRHSHHPGQPAAESCRVSGDRCHGWVWARGGWGDGGGGGGGGGEREGDAREQQPDAPASRKQQQWKIPQQNNRSWRLFVYLVYFAVRQCPLLALLVRGPQMVWECVCVCVCLCGMNLKYAVWLRWHIHISVHCVLCQCYAQAHAHAHPCPEVTLCGWQDIKIQLLPLLHAHPQTIWGQWTEGAKSGYCLQLKVADLSSVCWNTGSQSDQTRGGGLGEGRSGGTKEQLPDTLAPRKQQRWKFNSNSSKTIDCV